ncbi:hypothetical protein CRE_25876 [Caenorhabditis remanei]|uniref:Uncharacterized protein n=1 Tax=Caenorhabditis remanei TaxID=31234 RepID=E3NDS9_CAERE|nr:hypothetical protein CRE_25876 [Caenorhabditis remanei]
MLESETCLGNLQAASNLTTANLISLRDTVVMDFRSIHKRKHAITSLSADRYDFIFGNVILQRLPMHKDSSKWPMKDYRSEQGRISRFSHQETNKPTHRPTKQCPTTRRIRRSTINHHRTTPPQHRNPREIHHRFLEDRSSELNSVVPHPILTTVPSDFADPSNHPFAPHYTFVKNTPPRMNEHARIS